MGDTLSRLIEKAKAIRVTSAEREAQRRSFAFGNTAIENDQITMEMVHEVADKLKANQGR